MIVILIYVLIATSASSAEIPGTTSCNTKLNYHQFVGELRVAVKNADFCQNIVDNLSITINNASSSAVIQVGKAQNAISTTIKNVGNIVAALVGTLVTQIINLITGLLTSLTQGFPKDAMPTKIGSEQVSSIKNQILKVMDYSHNAKCQEQVDKATATLKFINVEINNKKIVLENALDILIKGVFGAASTVVKLLEDVIAAVLSLNLFSLVGIITKALTTLTTEVANIPKAIIKSVESGVNTVVPILTKIDTNIKASVTELLNFKEFATVASAAVNTAALQKSVKDLKVQVDRVEGFIKEITFAGQTTINDINNATASIQAQDNFLLKNTVKGVLAIALKIIQGIQGSFVFRLQADIASVQKFVDQISKAAAISTNKDVVDKATSTLNEISMKLSSDIFLKVTWSTIDTTELKRQLKNIVEDLNIVVTLIAKGSHSNSLNELSKKFKKFWLTEVDDVTQSLNANVVLLKTLDDTTSGLQKSLKPVVTSLSSA